LRVRFPLRVVFGTVAGLSNPLHLSKNTWNEKFETPKEESQISPFSNEDSSKKSKFKYSSQKERLSH
jgi:hypothetical protein